MWLRIITEILDHYSYDNIPEMIQASVGPIQVKVVRTGMNIADFMPLFKRFEVTLSNSGLIEGRTYTEN